ncbi:MAG: cation:proton antiporter [Methanomassiliicoccales archaeon]
MDADATFVLEMALVMILAAFIALAFYKLKMPMVIGYLAAGMILGPYTPGLQVDAEMISLLANLGIVLLMFCIGLEFNLRRLKQVGMFAILAGSIEVLIMLMMGYTLGLMLGFGGIASLILGGVLSISSTAVIIKVLTDRGEMSKKYAEAIIGILIIEDIAAVVILTITTPLAAGEAMGLGALVLMLLGIVFFLGISLVLGFAIVPRLMTWVAKGFPKEALLLVSLGLCFGMAVFANLLGLSVAIGAFIMGVIISQAKAPVSEDVMELILPLRDVFMAVFFVSIGMMIDPKAIASIWPMVLIIAAVFILGKIVAVTIGTYTANLDAKSSLIAGMSMVAMGEFSFVMAKDGLAAGSITPGLYSAIIGAALISMIAMPLVSARGERTYAGLVKRIPNSILCSMRRIENIRTEVRTWLATRQDRRREISLQVFWIFIDFVIVVLIEVIIGASYTLFSLLDDIAAFLSLVPSTFALIVAIVFMMGPLVDIVRRVRRIADILVEGVMASGKYRPESIRLFHKIFRNVGGIAVAIVLFVLIVPVAPMFSSVPVVLLCGVIIALAVTWLLWDTTNATYEKLCKHLGSTIYNELQLEEQLQDPPAKQE